MGVIEYLMANMDAVIAVLVAIHVLAVAVVNLTETPADDEFVAKVYGIVEKVGGIFTQKAKQLPGEAKSV